MTAIDAGTGSVEWVHVREHWSRDAEGSWLHALPVNDPFELHVAYEVVELERNHGWPAERLDASTGRLLEVRYGSLGRVLPEPEKVPDAIAFGVVVK